MKKNKKKKKEARESVKPFACCVVPRSTAADAQDDADDDLAVRGNRDGGAGAAGS
jgi:hypothetical protein